MGVTLSNFGSDAYLKTFPAAVCIIKLVAIAQQAATRMLYKLRQSRYKEIRLYQEKNIGRHLNELSLNK